MIFILHRKIWYCILMISNGIHQLREFLPLISLNCSTILPYLLFILQMNILVILIILAVLTNTISKITLSQSLAQKSMNSQTLLEYPYILVQTSHRSISEGSIQTLYCKLQISDKNKSKGYNSFVSNYNDIINKLVSMNIVPNSEMMAQSSIRIKFNKNKRKWQFNRYFVIIINEKQRQKVLSLLKKYNASRLKEAPKIRYLDEKYQALQTFYIARLEAEKYLKSIKGDQLEIIYVEDIEIEGSLLNKQRIQQELEYEANNSEPQISFGHIKNFQRGYRYHASNEILVRVLFKVGHQNLDEDSYDETIQQEDVSISQFNEEQESQNIIQLEDEQTL